MSSHSSMTNSFYLDQHPSIPADYIYDDLYKNVTNKSKFSRNPKYSYFNALMRMKQKLGDQQSIYEKVFQQPLAKDNENNHMFCLNKKREPLPVYHIEKINKMKFKIYKQKMTNNYVNKLPIADINFQVHMKDNRKVNTSERPRLDEILAEYRKMNATSRIKGESQPFRKYSGANLSNKGTANSHLILNKGKFGKSISFRK